MLPTKKKVLYFIIFSTIPFLLWIVTDQKVHSITFFLLCLLYPISRFWKPIKSFNETFEIIFLFLAVSYLLNQIGLDNFFPANIIIIISFLYLFLFVFKKSDRTKLFFKFGTIKENAALVILFSLLSIIFLTAWFLNQQGNPYVKFIPDVPTYFLIPMGIGFAIINAFYEESLFRSILLSHISSQVGFIPAMILQAIWFSFLHFQSGFPSGFLGIILTFIFGLMMGIIVKRTKGIFIPIIIHFFADLSIFILIILRMKNVI